VCVRVRCVRCVRCCNLVRLVGVWQTTMCSIWIRTRCSRPPDFPK
jgi:hypothetical protein